MSSIEWTDETWNPVRGCTRVSPGCENCYAERQAIRMSGPGGSYEGLVRIGKKGPVWTGVVRFVPEQLEAPLRWRRPRRVFVNSMSDLFHESVTVQQIAAIFGIMAACPKHTFQILTKRPERAVRWFRWVDELAGASAIGEPEHPWWRVLVCSLQAPFRGISSSRAPFSGATWPLENVHLLVSVEDQTRAKERIPLLFECPAAVRGVSYEPALGPVDFTPWLMGLDWVIVGGESGPGARPFDVRWARQTISACKAAQVPCFVKQLGARPVFTDDERDLRVTEAYELALDANGHEHLVPSAEDYAKGIVIPLRSVKGGDPYEWPEDLRVRDWPRTCAVDATPLGLASEETRS